MPPPYSATGKQCVCVPPRVCMSVYSSSLMWANYKCLNPLFLNFHLMSCFSKVMKRTRTSSGTSLTWHLTTRRNSNAAARTLKLDLPNSCFFCVLLLCCFPFFFVTHTRRHRQTHTHTHLLATCSALGHCSAGDYFSSGSGPTVMSLCLAARGEHSGLVAT